MNYPSGRIFLYQRGDFRHLYWVSLWLLGLFLCTAQSLQAQDISSLKDEGNGYYEIYQAAQYYQVAVGLAPDDPLVNYRLAESYREIFNYPLAASYYQATLNLDPFSYPLALFYLARMNKAVGQFQLAKNQFDSFVSKFQGSQILEISERDRFVAQAKIESSGCEWAMQQLASPFNEQGFVNLPQPVNSTNNDYAVAIMEHDTSITITSGRKGTKGALVDNRYGDYFTDNMNFVKGSQWQRTDLAQRFEIVNTKFSDGAGCYNRTRDTYYFTSCYEGNAFCQLYVIRLNNERWSRPKQLNQQINLPGYDNRHPALSPGGDTLYFTSNRPGGLGGNDIWMSTSKDGDDWGAPSLVPAINTPFNEVAPYLHHDGTLFFSSDGHVGFGGLDIFSISPISSAPQNLGVPVNSGFDDTFFTIGDKLGYLSSNRIGGLGKFDIYQFPWPGSAQALAEQFKGRASGDQLRSRIRQYSNRNLVSARDEDQFYYDNLTAEERAQINRILAARRLSGTYFNPANLADEDFKYYQKLDIETKAIIERLAQRELQKLQGVDEFGNNQVNFLEPSDLQYYEGISAEERKIIDRIIAAKVEDRKETLEALNANERDYWQTNSSQTQQRIERQAQDLAFDQQQEQLRSEAQQASERINQNQTQLDRQPHLSDPQVQAVAGKLSEAYQRTIEQRDWQQKLLYQKLTAHQKDDLHKLALKKFIEDSDLAPDNKQSAIEQLALPQEGQLLASLSPQDQVNAKALIDAIAEVIMNQTQGLDPQMLQTFENLTDIERLALELQAQQKLLSLDVQKTTEDQEAISSIREEIQSEVPAQPDLSEEQQQTEQALAEKFSQQAQTFAIRKLQPREAYYFNTLTPTQNLEIQKLSQAIVRSELQAINLDPALDASLTEVDRAFFKSLPPSEQLLLEQIILHGMQSGSDEEVEQYLTQLDAQELNRVQRLRTQYLQSATQTPDTPLSTSWSSEEYPQLSTSSRQFLEEQPVDQQPVIRALLSKGLESENLSNEEKQYLNSLDEPQKEQLAKAIKEIEGSGPSQVVTTTVENLNLSNQDRAFVQSLPESIQEEYLQLIAQSSDEITIDQLTALNSWSNLSGLQQDGLKRISGLESTVDNPADIQLADALILDNISGEDLNYLESLTPLQQKEIKNWLQQPSEEGDLGKTYTPEQVERLRAIKSAYHSNSNLEPGAPTGIPQAMKEWHANLPATSAAQLDELSTEERSILAEIVAKNSLNFEDYQGTSREFLESMSLSELQGLQGMMDVYTQVYPEMVPQRYQSSPSIISGQLTDASLNPLPGQPVDLLDENQSVVGSIVTDQQGVFSFNLDEYQRPLQIRVPGVDSFEVQSWIIKEDHNNSTEHQPETTVDNQATESKPPLQTEQGSVVTSGTTSQIPGEAIIYFDFDRHDLRPEAKKTIDAVADFLKQNSTAEVTVAGHTDYIGSDHYNQQLSQRRSNAAARYLQTLIPRLQPKVQAFGESNPLFSNRTPFGRQYNRRVELLIKGAVIYRAPMRTVLIKPGVSLSTLARNLGVSEETILAWNGTTKRVFRAYQPIRLPSATNFEQYHRLVFDPASKSDQFADAKYHLVRFGDTLFRLAARYDTTVERLEELNQMEASDLKAGTRIRVR